MYLTEGGGETLSNLQGYPSTQEARTTLGRLSLGGHKTTHGRETEMHPAQHRLRDSATFLPGVSVRIVKMFRSYCIWEEFFLQVG